VVHPVRLSIASVDEVASGYDLVIDGTDNFPTRYLSTIRAFAWGAPGLGVDLPVRRLGRGLLEGPTTGK
jgi:molybdopterin/thiamine biosynthesis adenylyltransferase